MSRLCVTDPRFTSAALAIREASGLLTVNCWPYETRAAPPEITGRDPRKRYGGEYTWAVAKSEGMESTVIYPGVRFLSLPLALGVEATWLRLRPPAGTRIAWLEAIGAALPGEILVACLNVVFQLAYL